MLYRVLLFVHVTAVIAWVGAGIVFQVVSERAAGSRTEGPLRTLVGLGDVFSPAFFGILTGLVLLSGLGLVLEGGWGFDHYFVLGGIVGVVASGAIGGAVIGPTATRLQQKVRDSEVDGATADLLRLRNVGRVDLLIMLVVVYLMTVKPGG